MSFVCDDHEFSCRINDEASICTAELLAIEAAMGGGKGVTSAWSPLGNFLEGQAHPNLSSNQVCLFF